ncbi:MAG: dTDP-4-dehydrorhamnose 3,5-epimerase [Cyanobacteria bacterium]|nr:dTDP-4-dehydrorhamnose 3,5-epimerase [Cyanobacteriota bacterium]
MDVIKTRIPGVLVLTPQVFGDSRGFFFESFNQRQFNELTQTPYDFLQDNHSRSEQGTLRGLHYQLERPQGKLLRVVIGSIYDVAVDLRRSSPTFGQWLGRVLDAEHQQQIWIPPGFAHGFYVISPAAEVLYKTTDYYHPSSERTLAWNDPTLAIDWPLTLPPKLSAKDQRGTLWAQAEVFP